MNPLVFISEGTSDRDSLVDSLSRFLEVVGVLTITSVATKIAVEWLLYSSVPTPIETNTQNAPSPMTNVSPLVGAYVLLVGLLLLISYDLITVVKREYI